MAHTFAIPVHDFIRVCEQLLSEDFTSERLNDEEIAIVKMYIEMLSEKFIGG